MIGLMGLGVGSAVVGAAIGWYSCWYRAFQRAVRLMEEQPDLFNELTGITGRIAPRG